MQMSATSEGIAERGARARRHNHALVALGRRVWREDCDFETAIALICEVAAEALEVERVNVWRLDPEQRLLHCIHAYTRSAGQHNPPGFDETVAFNADYGAQLDEVRVIDIADVNTNELVSADNASLQRYLRQYDIQSMLDAPVRNASELLGVISHEHIGCARVWSPEDHAFAGSLGDYVAVAYQIAHRRRLESRLRYLERHDPHTNLPNRDHLLEVAHSALRPMHDHDTGLVAIHLQIEMPEDDDPTGIETYHRFLIDSAERLRDMLADQAVLARVRDDALAVIPHRHLQEVEALELAERCIDMIEAGKPQGQLSAAIATAGIAFSRDLAAPSADALLRNAENASLHARSHGYGRCKVFNADRHRSLLARMRIEQSLREAFAEGRIFLQYMPEVDLSNGCWRSAEALLRWRGDDDRIVPAAEFIEAAESSGLILRIGRWALQQACHAAQQWPRRDGAQPLLRVNVSARQFEEAGLAADVATALNESGLAPERLCLELTETVLLRDHDTAAKTIARVRALGVKVALDDFGTGYCSLGYLKHLPIDTIKIDRSFTAGLPHDQADLAIVRALMHLAEGLGIDVVGEGVENQAQADCLRACGVTAVQGYLYSPAIDQEALLSGFIAHAAR
ncbi:MAG: GGDEF domain-containing protein [Lysobacteraceae bacterium]|nr:MAG: GGDEF domain-containing protein [Xanthomonadaceae bacterium]